MVLYWGFLIWGFCKPHLGIFYGSVDFQGFSIWGFSYTIDELHWGDEIHWQTSSGGGPIHARVPIHAHPQFS